MKHKLLQISSLLIISIVFLLSSYSICSIDRYFNFDEFQVVSTGKALLDGRSLYGDNVGSHFPLLNLFMVGLTLVFEATPFLLIVARLFIFFFLLNTLYLIYKIAERLRSKIIGLIAVLFVVTSLVFLKKGIEIRHDVFNMFFNTLSIYMFILYLQSKKKYYLILSSTFSGFAVACTQKAIIWSLGIFAGFIYILFKKERVGIALKRIFLYFIIFILPIGISFLILIIFFNESFAGIVSETILKQFAYILPGITGVQSIPFPFSKLTVFTPLLLENGAFYLLGIAGMIYFLINQIKNPKEEFILATWLLSGILFYIFMKRPFYQAFLPSIPALGIIAAIFVNDLYKKFGFDKLRRKNTYVLLLLIAIIIYPSFLIVEQGLTLWNLKGFQAPVFKMGLNNEKQFKNVSFCIQHLEKFDKVLCFTQQQLFYEPLLNFNDPKQVKNIKEIDENTLINEIKRTNCKIIIFDYRTTLLNKEILKKLGANYIYSGNGDIFIPGFRVNPGQHLSKDVWIEGKYNLSSEELLINGISATKKEFYFKQKKYDYTNTTDNVITISYGFSG